MSKANEEKNFEELNQEKQRLEYELNRSLRIEQKLTERLARKEHEIALMAVQMDDLKAGFEALRQKNDSELKAK